MTEFKAPPPPSGGFTTAPQPQVSQQTESSVTPSEPHQETAQSTTQTAFNKFQTQKEKVVGKFNALPSNKKQVIIAAGVFVIGLLMGGIMFGGSDEPAAPAPQGLQGVVKNPDIKEPLKRCGQVEASLPCVLYVMNSYTYEKLASDFFETAVSVTRRKDLVIRMDNVRYATMRIPPGHFAQIKIPAYK